MSKTINESQWIPGIHDTPENVAKALMTSAKSNVVKPERGIKQKKQKKRKKSR